MESTGAASPSPDICRNLLLNQPKIFTTINTDFEHMFSVICSTDEQILTRGDSNIIKLYNLQGELLESIRTKSDNDPRDIKVSKCGHLVYSDFDERIVNIVMNKQISEVMKLRTWRSLRVNSTVSGDLLVTVVGDKKKRTKVVRCAYSIEVN